LTGDPLIPFAASVGYPPIANPSLHRADAEDGNPICRHRGERQYLVPIRASGDRLPFFGVFPSPPGSSEFADILPQDQPLYDFYFSRLDGASNFPTVERLALTFLEELRKVQPHGPYQLCGYSKAGLVAYEIARLLLSEGESVTLLALFETWHPGYERHLTRKELVRFRFLHIVDRLQKYGRNLIQGRFLYAVSVAWKGTSRRVKLFGWRAARRVLRTASRPVPNGMQQVESIVVLKSFIPKPYPKRFMLIRTDDPFERKLKDPTFGWHVCATEGVDVQFVPGDQDHSTMLDKPYVRGVLDRIMPYLADPRRP
jgi:thioesterase domain-containing protein